MNKLLPFFLVLSLVSASCNKDGTGEDPTDTTTPGMEDGNTTDPGDDSTDETGTDNPTPPPTSTVPSQALTFKTNVELLNFTTTQEAKYEKAIKLVKLVVATEEFRDRVLNHKYNGAKSFANNDGKTNAQIYQSVLDAAEKLKPTKNNTMDLEVELYYASTNVVGYTYPSTTQIWVNTKYFNTYAINSVAANLFHEWLHKLGYGHDSDATTRRPYSVPYGIGSIIRDIGQDFL
jgi:hypothetical protein